MTSSKNNSSSTDSFDVLENEFDKAFVDLDVLIGEFEQENVRDPFLEVKINFLFFSKVRIIF